MKAILLTILLLASGCSTTFLIDKRQCKGVGPDHLQCPDRAVSEVK